MKGGKAASLASPASLASQTRHVACRLSRVIGSCRLPSIAIEREEHACRDRLALKGREPLSFSSRHSLLAALAALLSPAFPLAGDGGFCYDNRCLL